MGQAKFFTMVFNPLIWPMIIFSILFWLGQSLVPTMVNKWVLWVLIASGSFLVPVFMIFTLRNAGLIETIQMKKRSERHLPMFLTVIVYMGLSWMLFQKTPRIVHYTFFGVGLVLLFISLITLFWKISAHVVASSGSAFFIVFLGIQNTNLAILIAGLLLLVLTGFVIWSRLKLLAHTNAEVWAGFFVGFFSSFGLLLIP